VISTHLPPPVMIDSTEVRKWDPHIVLDLGHVHVLFWPKTYFFARRPSAVSTGTLMKWVAALVDCPVRPSGSGAQPCSGASRFASRPSPTDYGAGNNASVLPISL